LILKQLRYGRIKIGAIEDRAPFMIFLNLSDIIEIFSRAKTSLIERMKK